jgi:hypothetical protein
MSLSFGSLDRSSLVPDSIVLCSVHSNYTSWFNLLRRLLYIADAKAGNSVPWLGYCIEDMGLILCTGRTLICRLECIRFSLSSVVVQSDQRVGPVNQRNARYEIHINGKDTTPTHLTFMLPCKVIDFFLNNQPDALIIKICSVIKLYRFRASPLPIIRSSLLYIRHW